MNTGDRIKQRRIELGLTADDLAQKIGKSRATIYRYENAEKTSKTYALSKEKERELHDDRFYTLIMLAHRLYELRRTQIIQPKRDEPFDYTSAPICASAVSY